MASGLEASRRWSVVSANPIDPGENRWRPLPPLSIARAEPAVAALGGRLLVAGGDGPSDQELATCESYDLRRGRWRPEPPLPTARRCAQLGSAIKQIVETTALKVAIIASGGMSHYPGAWKYPQPDLSAEIID